MADVSERKLGEESLRLMTVSARSLVQRRLLLEVSAAGVDQVGVSVEQSAKLVDAALIGGVENGAEFLLHLRRTSRAALHVARQNLDRLVAICLGDLVNDAAVGIGRAGVEAGRKRAANGFNVARVGCVENAFAFELRRIAAIDMASDCGDFAETFNAGEFRLTPPRQPGGYPVLQSKKSGQLHGFPGERREKAGRRGQERAFATKRAAVGPPVRFW